jgi:hypothetical protein
MDDRIGPDLVPQHNRNVTMNHLDFPVHFLQVRSARFFDEFDETISFFGKARA